MRVSSFFCSMVFKTTQVALLFFFLLSCCDCAVVFALPSKLIFLFIYCVAYTKCIATLWYHLIYLFIYLFVYESRAPVTWSSVVALVESLGSRNFFQVIVSRASSPGTSQQTQTQLVL